MKNDSILHTLQTLMHQMENDIRKQHHELICARQTFMDTQQAYKDVKTLYEQRYEFLKASESIDI